MPVTLADPAVPERASAFELGPILRAAFGRPVLDVNLELAPMPSPRARFRRATGSAYMPTPYVKHKQAIRELLASAAATDMLSGPLRIHVVVRLPIPASYPRWKREAAERGDVWPHKSHRSGDVDNYLKTPMDAASRDRKKAGAEGAWPGIWRDDGGVPGASCDLLFARPDVLGGRPHWRVTVWKMPGQLAGDATRGEA